jgi:hypothetical protein
VSSRWVKTEAAEGAVRGILVPVLIDKVQIPLEFKRIEAADLSDWQGTSPHPEFDHLLKTVASILGGIAPTKVKQIPTNTKLRSWRWWKTMPGILAATGGVITVVTGLVVVLHQSGFFDGKEKQLPQNQNHFQAQAPTGRASNERVERPAQAGSPVPSSPAMRKSESASGPPVPATVSEPLSRSKRVNLLASENGGHLVTASSDAWQATIDGREDFSQISYGTGTEAVYAFQYFGHFLSERG